MKVAIVGEGERFDAVASLLGAAGHAICAWRHDGRDADFGEGIEEVELEALRETPLIFVAVPMSSLRLVARAIGDVLTGRHAVVHASHSLEAGSLATGSDVLREETPTRRFGFVTGPMRSDDVQRGLPASGVCASAFPEVWELAEEALVHPGFRLYRSTDIAGAEIAAAYTRIIAMAAGVAHEMKLGHSVQATLFARGLAEAARFAASRGANERTTFGLAGAANLHLDTTAPGSPDFRVGRHALAARRFDAAEIAATFGTTGRDLLQLVESLAAGSPAVRTHILHACHSMVSGASSPEEAVARLMTLPALDD